MNDLNSLIVTYTKHCKRHNEDYNVLAGCTGCLLELLKQLNNE
jgi:hypothetical protein